MFKKYFCVVLLSISSILSAQSIENEQLVTIHGILGSSWNLQYLTASLEKEKMVVNHWGYPSRDKNIVAHAKALVIHLQQLADKNPGKTIHFLTHSMGGLVLRAALNQPDCPAEAKWGKVVLLAPPNQGAGWGRLIGELSLAQYIGKDKSGKELMTQVNFEHLGQFPDTLDVFVIAGNFSFNPFIYEENDGTVAVSETFLTTPHKHQIINAGHKSILLSQPAANLIRNFFKDAE